MPQQLKPQHVKGMPRPYSLKHESRDCKAMSLLRRIRKCVVKNMPDVVFHILFAEQRNISRSGSAKLILVEVLAVGSGNPFRFRHKLVLKAKTKYPQIIKAHDMIGMSMGDGEKDKDVNPMQMMNDMMVNMMMTPVALKVPEWTVCVS